MGNEVRQLQRQLAMLILIVSYSYANVIQMIITGNPRTRDGPRR